MLISIETILSLIIATAILGLSPGPAVFATIARAITLPLSKISLFILGIVLGDLVFAILAMSGIALLAAEHIVMFNIIKCAGGGYLLYLGLKGLTSKESTHDIKAIAPEKGWALITSGFLLTAGNPKDLLFFVSFLPAFINLRTASPADIATIAIVIAMTFTATLFVYVGITKSAKTWLNTPCAMLWLNRMAGAILVLIGLVILWGDWLNQLF